MIRYLELQNIPEYLEPLKDFFSQVPFGRYLTDKSFSEKVSVEFEIQQLTHFTKKGILCLAINENNKISGLIGFNFSLWDTEVFKKRTALIQYFLVKDAGYSLDAEIASNLLNIFHDWVAKNKIDVAIARLESKYFIPVKLFQENDYCFYECITQRSLDLRTNNYEIAANVNYRFAKNEEKEKLKEIALKNTFNKSHFYLDSNFEVSKVELMYSKWLATALNSNKKIVVIENENAIAGIFIYELVDLTELFGIRVGIWEFAAIDSQHRKKGLGTILFESALDACIKEGANVIDSSLVEKNIISQRLHDKLGFGLVNSYYRFHKWFKVN
jgi:GNAT superfamily N-acetyltransferase